ncbi:MAG: hypothetical protein ACJ77N_02410 [Chloroflexota bacterium]
MVKRHRRFALHDVTLEGEPIGGATVDAWQDDDGTERWAARAAMPAQLEGTTGLLTGTTRGGAVVSGRVRIAGGQIGPRSPRTTLVDLHGTGALLDDEGAKQAG